jgi:hypothetical protein
MFKSNPFAGFTPLRGGNGSVPSIGGTPTLASAMARVEAAEQILSAARAAARAAAKAEGKSTRYLFDGHPYVARSSAEKWVDEARAEGWRDGHAFLSDALSRANRPPDPADPLYHIAKRLERNRAAGVTPADLARLRDRMEAAGAFAAMQAGDVEKAARICADLQREEAGHVTGERIVRAAARARMSADTEVPLPEKGSFAAKVIAAGKKRRNES